MECVIRPTLLEQKTYATFNGGERSNSLAGLCLELLSEQRETWPLLRKGYESLEKVRERLVPCKGFAVLLQHNTGRMKSTMAHVGENDTSKRRCFLCLDHLPEGQKGILYRNQYLILCNPMPVFSSHFTIAHVSHRPQAVSEHIDIFLQLMSDLGSGWTLLYNGPKCGASAPDHFHFQAVPTGRMPIEKELRREKRAARITQVGQVALYHTKDLGREAIILEGDDPIAVGSAFTGFLNALKKVLCKDEEPMINLAGFHEEAKWRLIIFTRRKHRPEAFFKTGDARVAVSPAVIEMGGVFVTPFAKDFERLDAATVESIYEEVSLGTKTVEGAVDAMGRQ